MAEVDYVVRNLKLKYEGIFEPLEIYKLVKHFFSENGYTFLEREYEEKKKDLRNTKIKFDCGKKLDDYNKIVIRTTVKIGDYEDVEIKNKKYAKGNLETSFDTYLERDYEELYEKKPLRKFFRTIYDRFIVGARAEKYESQLKDDVYRLFNELKEFLNLYKFK